MDTQPHPHEAMKPQGGRGLGEEDTHLASCVQEQGPRVAGKDENFLGDIGGWEGGVGGLSPLPGPREESLRGWS